MVDFINMRNRNLRQIHTFKHFGNLPESGPRQIYFEPENVFNKKCRSNLLDLYIFISFGF